MNEELQYHNTLTEEITVGPHGFRKSCDQPVEAREMAGFFATPLRHPLTAVLGVVKKACEKYLRRVRLPGTGRNYKVAAIKESLTSEDTEDLPNPVPRKVPGGNGGFQMMLRHPFMTCRFNK